MVLAVISCGGCDNHLEQAGPRYEKITEITDSSVQTYCLAVHPLYNPVQLESAYGPLIRYLNKEIPAGEFRLEASRSYASYEEKIRDGGVTVRN